MIPLIGLIAASGGHPLALAILIAVFGLLLSITKGGSKLVAMTGDGVAGGLLVFLGATGAMSQIGSLLKWSLGLSATYIGFVVLLLILWFMLY